MLSDDRSGLRMVAVLLASIGLHAVIVVGSLFARPWLAKSEPAQFVSSHFSGNTFDVDAVVESGTLAPAPAFSESAPGGSEPEPASEGKVPAPETKTATVTLPAPSIPKPKAIVRPSTHNPDSRRSETKPAKTRTASAKPESGSADGVAHVKSSAASDEKTGSSGGLVYGAAGLPRGVRNLPKAFTRAIPPATRADPAWAELPLGKVGTIRVKLELDDTGHITEADVESDPPRPGDLVPLHFVRLKQRVVALLGGGQFALKTTPGAGTQTLLIEVTLSLRSAREDVEPNHAFNLGSDPPEAGRPGRAYFTLGSGRHFEAKVRIVSE